MEDHDQFWRISAHSDATNFVSSIFGSVVTGQNIFQVFNNMGHCPANPISNLDRNT